MMHFIHKSVEFIKQLLALSFHVVILLKLNFVLPLSFPVETFYMFDITLEGVKLFLDFEMVHLA